MDEILALPGQNLLSPIILSFVLGLAAALARSDLSFPEAVAKGLSLYLLFAIGFKAARKWRRMASTRGWFRRFSPEWLCRSCCPFWRSPFCGCWRGSR